MIEQTVEFLLEDMFEVEPDQDRQLEDVAKNQSKEAKANKVPLIFELYSQFLDFNENFPLFLTPIIK